jgi:hypothetical protein
MTELLTTGLTASRKTTVKYAEYGASAACIPGESDEKWAKLSLDASKSIIGILSNSQPSTVITNLIQINQGPEQAKELTAIEIYLQDKVWQTEPNNTVTTGIAAPHTDRAEIAHLGAIDPAPARRRGRSRKASAAGPNVDSPVDNSTYPPNEGMDKVLCKQGNESSN